MSVFYTKLAILGWVFALIVVLVVLVILAIRRSRRRQTPPRGFEVQMGRSDEKQS